MRFLRGLLEVLGRFSGGLRDIFGDFVGIIVLGHYNVFGRCFAECCTVWGSLAFRFLSFRFVSTPDKLLFRKGSIYFSRMIWTLWLYVSVTPPS